MRWLALVISLAASVAGAGEVELRLPPSDQWVEQPDPNPPPTATAKTRFFVRKDDAELTLRVITDASLRLDYSVPVLQQLGRQLVAAQQRPGGTPLKISEPKLYSAEGVDVGSLQIIDPEHVSTVFYVPSENGDRVLTAQSPRSKQIDLQEMVTFVQSAKGLRKADTWSSSGTTIMGTIAFGSIGVIVTLLWFMRKK